MRQTAQSGMFGGTFDIPLPYGERLQAAAAGPQPMLEAARPLLQALRDTPPELGANDVLARRQWLLSEAKMFERICTGLKLPRADADNARYCLCSALDEAAMLTPWGKGATTGTEWSANGLATTLGYDRQGADRVFNLIDSATRHPTANSELLAVLQQILASGFKGRYRRTPDGARTLKAVLRNVDQALSKAKEAQRAAGATRHTRDQADTSASTTEDTVLETPRGARSEARATRRTASADDVADVAYRMGPPRRGSAIKAGVRSAPGRPERNRYAAGALGALLALALLGAGGYGLYAWRMDEATQTGSLDTIAAGIRSRLAQAIDSKTVSLNENADHSRLAVRVDGMFAPGQYTLHPAAVPSVTQVGEAIAAAPANVLVHLTGYTDDTPFEKVGGFSNQALSTLRAQSVMQVLASAGVSPERITVSGSGDSSPLDDNHTREGRARNRRVEIAVEQWQ